MCVGLWDFLIFVAFLTNSILIGPQLYLPPGNGSTSSPTRVGLKYPEWFLKQEAWVTLMKAVLWLGVTLA